MTTIKATNALDSARHLFRERLQDSAAAPTASDGGFSAEVAAAGDNSSETLQALRGELTELKRNQLQMSNAEYLTAKFTIEEQIATERLNAGEDLDQINVRFKGRIFHLAGKIFSAASLQAAQIDEADLPARPRVAEFATLRRS